MRHLFIPEPSRTEWRSPSDSLFKGMEKRVFTQLWVHWRCFEEEWSNRFVFLVSFGNRFYLFIIVFIFCIVIRLHGHLIKNAQSLLSGSCLSSNLCWTWVRSKAGQGKAGVTGERSKVWKRDASRFQFFFFFLLCLALISSLSFYGWAILLPLFLFSSSLRLLLL